MPGSRRFPGHLPPVFPCTLVLPGRRWGYGAQSALVELLRDRAGQPAGEERTLHSRSPRRMA